MGKMCSVEGCDNRFLAKGLCGKHYARMWRSGSLKLTKRPYGGGGPNGNGYWRIQVNGKSVLEHVHMAELVLGKPLPPKAIVHHVDGRPAHNVNSNFVVCQNHAYHNLLHKRKRALEMGGGASFEWCWLCRTHDDPKNMMKSRRWFYHQGCKKNYDAKRYAKKKEKTNVVSL